MPAKASRNLTHTALCPRKQAILYCEGDDVFMILLRQLGAICLDVFIKNNIHAHGKNVYLRKFLKNYFSNPHTATDNGNNNKTNKI